MHDKHQNQPDHSKWARPALAVYWLTLAATTHWPRLDVSYNGTSAGDINLDKPMHAAAFGLLALLFYLAKPLGKLTEKRTTWFAAFLVVGCYAFIDEYTQKFVERTFSPADLLGNLVGISIVMGALAVHAFKRQTVGDAVQPMDLRATAKSESLLGGFGLMHWSRMTLLIFMPALLICGLQRGGSVDWSWWLPMGPHKADRFELRADYVQHLVVALAGTLLIAGSRPLGKTRPGWGSIFAIILSMVGGGGLELVQKFVGRGAEWLDFLAHTIGTLMALSIILGCWVATRGPAVKKTVSDTVSGSPPEVATPEAGTPKTVSDTVSGDVAEAQQQAASEKEKNETRFVGHARTVSLLTLLSRMTGLVRDSILAAVLGLGGVADAFTMGFLLPNLFRRLFGEGALSAAFIPAYADMLANDRDRAKRLASACIALLTVLLGILVLIGEAVLYGLQFVRPWSETTMLAFRLMMLMLPYMPLVCLVALIGGMLQVHHKFGSTAAAPVLLNLFMIAAAGVGGSMYEPEQVVMIVGFAVVSAGALQLMWQFMALLPHEKFTMQWDGVGKPLRDIALVMLPMLIGLAVFQINAALDTLIAYSLSAKATGEDFFMLFGYKVGYPIESGAAAALSWSQRLYQFPLGVFGIAVATAIFPALSRAAAKRAEDGGEQFVDILRNGLRLTVFIGLPASVGLILVRVPLCRLVYQYGRFDIEDAQRVASILIGYASAIWAYSMMHVLTRAFYAVKDAKTPLRVSVVTVLLNFLMNLVLIWFLGVAGLAWSTAVCAVWQVALLVYASRQYADQPVNAAVWKSWGKTLVLSALMGLAILGGTWSVDVMQFGRAASAGMLAAMVLGGAIVFAGGAWLWKLPELRWLLRRG